MKRVATCLAALAIFAVSAVAGEKSVMHCFAFTPIETASEADWNAFHKATDALPGQVPGLKRVWAGKLARPLTQNQVRFADAEARKKAMADKKGTGDYAILTRSHGVCMEFENQQAFTNYDPHPAHKSWVSVYEKVRVPGTTTFQIIGQ